LNRTKNLQGACARCGGPIEFPAELVGTTAPCPTCGQPTELLLAAPPQESAVPRRMLVWIVVAVVISVIALVALMVGLRLARNWATRPAKHGAVEVVGPWGKAG
jgi:hypothetical protein